MSKVYFVSDIHIRDMQEEKAQNFLRFLLFLQTQNESITLVLGGDIFDLWLGSHSYFIKKFFPIVEAIKSLVQQKNTVYYFEGNHDLHLKKFWQRNIGVTVYSDPEFFLFDQSIVRFEHGDQMDPEDHGYHFLRWFLRTPVLIFLILNLPAWFIAKIGNLASQASRKYTDNLRDEERIKNILHTYSEQVFDERPYNFFVHGHVHLRDVYSFERGEKEATSINLGSWDSKPSILVLHNGQWQWLDEWGK